MEKIAQLKNIIESSNNIVFFGGAGVSTESNIPDFRSQNGLYNSQFDYPPEIILSYSFFINNPKIFYKFYRAKMVYRDALPNDAHYALARLEKKGKLKWVITQNIDNLHQMAGSKNVLELHGSIYRNYCMHCHKEFSLDYIMDKDDIPYCDHCHGIIRPDVVLYEEPLNEEVMRKARNAIYDCDLLIIGGTSLSVYPAAGLVNHYCGKNLVIINRGLTQFNEFATLVINESIGKVLKEV